jgi:hypothetical protein
MQRTVKPEAAAIASNIDKKPLTPAETKLLAKCEKTIGKGLKAFKKVADALLDVRDQRLYRIEYATFEDYCRIKWEFTARHANRLMLAGNVVENLKSDQLVSTDPMAVPENEGQARPLAVLKPEQQVKAAQIVAKKPGKHTAKDFENAADEVTGEKPRITVPPQSATKTAPARPSMENLIEVIDEVETMVRVGKPKEAVLAKLKLAADLATRINNGGGR